MPSADPERHLRHALPLHPEWTSDDEYVESLLTFATTSDLFRNLCGGVHVLDFLTREPDLYATVLPVEWRDWFDQVSVEEILEFLLRQDLTELASPETAQEDSSQKMHPPESLVDYVHTIRKHCLQRQFSPVSDTITNMPKHLSVGMKTKKVHEVTNFAAYVGMLSADVAERVHEPVSVVDFGSGQNYLGRTLASPPYNKHVIAIERKHHNIAGAKHMDVHARLAKKEKVMRNKKEWKRQLIVNNGMPTPPSEQGEDESSDLPDEIPAPPEPLTKYLDDSTKGSMTYVEHDVQDGRIEEILFPPHEQEIHQNEGSGSSEHEQHPGLAAGKRPKTMVVSLHSCGNLSHHGIRSLILNPSVCAVAMIGCCYNLLTERLGPASYKLPQLRPNHPRLEATGAAYDPHGFPMSQTLEDFSHPSGEAKGVRLNITARMMAVQAPYNWGAEDSEAFFRRHFYRALLQRILLDLDVVKQHPDPGSGLAGGSSVTGKETTGTPLIVGSLRKACFGSFRAYVHGALAKLREDPVDGAMIAERTAGLTDEAIDDYEARWGHAKKHLSIIWSLMAFSAGVVESIIVADRWLFLREQAGVDDCWVDIVFDYKESPRNFVVVGIKEKDD